MFHSVDQLWDKNGYIFQYIPAQKDKSQVTIPGPTPLLCYEFGDDIIKSLTPDAFEWMRMAKYDVESRQSIISDGCIHLSSRGWECGVQCRKQKGQG